MWFMFTITEGEVTFQIRHEIPTKIDLSTSFVKIAFELSDNPIKIDFEMLSAISSHWRYPSKHDFNE